MNNRQQRPSKPVAPYLSLHAVKAARKVLSSPRRRWLTRLVLALTVPTLLILGTEASLRIGGFGYPTEFFIKVPNRNHYGSNRQFSRQFFPRAIARQPLLLRVPATKSPQAYRIFVLGASAAMGVPAPAFSFSRILEVMLADRFPQLNFEVVNTSIVAINSHVVRSIVRDCTKHQVDLFIIYLGNNEVIGPYGIQAGVNRIPGSLSFIQLGIWFRTTKIGQLYQQIAAKITGQDELHSKWPGMEMYTDHHASPDDSRLHKIHENFRQNLKAICASATESGAKTLLATVAVNLRNSPPFASLQRPDMTPDEIQHWNGLYQAGIAAEQSARYDEAEVKYLACTQLDDRHAELNFRLGRIWLKQGDNAKAAHYFWLAREEDTLRFRADSKINRIIREVAAANRNHDIHLIDLAEILKRNDPGQYNIPGEELFFEHVHLKFAGNYLIAAALCEKVSNLIPRRSLGDRPVTLTVLTSEECRRKLTFTPWNKYNSLVSLLGLVKHPPFTNQMEHQVFVADLEAKATEMKKQGTLENMQRTYLAYQKALSNDPEDLMLRFNYRILLKELRLFDKAEVQLRILRAEMPPD